jgi:hypothetical protein
MKERVNISLGFPKEMFSRNDRFSLSLSLSLSLPLSQMWKKVLLYTFGHNDCKLYRLPVNVNSPTSISVTTWKRVTN